VTQRLHAGDAVVTQNNRTGKVVKVETDSTGSYVIVKLDVLSGEYAFDIGELRKVGLNVRHQHYANSFRRTSREAV